MSYQSPVIDVKKPTSTERFIVKEMFLSKPLSHCSDSVKGEFNQSIHTEMYLYIFTYFIFDSGISKNIIIA